MIEHTPFSTPIYETNVMINRVEIVKEFYGIRDRFPSEVSISNVGGWQSNPMTPADVVEFHWISKTVRSIANVSKTIFDSWGIDKSPEVSLWFNINGHDNFNLRHSHIGKNSSPILSGCFYASVPEDSGDIVFVRPGQHLSVPDTVSNEYVSNLFGYTPSGGKALFFPSSLEHYVEPNKSSEDRLSMAFNVI